MRVTKVYIARCGILLLQFPLCTPSFQRKISFCFALFFFCSYFSLLFLFTIWLCTWRGARPPKRLLYRMLRRRRSKKVRFVVVARTRLQWKWRQSSWQLDMDEARIKKMERPIRIKTKSFFKNNLLKMVENVKYNFGNEII